MKSEREETKKKEPYEKEVDKYVAYLTGIAKRYQRKAAGFDANAAQLHRYPAGREAVLSALQELEGLFRHSRKVIQQAPSEPDEPICKKLMKG